MSFLHSGSESVVAVLLLMFLVNGSCFRGGFRINSLILRDRIVSIDKIILKKALYVAFDGVKKGTAPEELIAEGSLVSEENEVVGTARTLLLNEQAGNLVFDLPYELPSAHYTVAIKLMNSQGKEVSELKHSVSRNSLRNDAWPVKEPPPSGYTAFPGALEISEYQPAEHEKSRGYVLFSRSPMQYVFPGSHPSRNEVIKRKSLRVVRNEQESITFSLFPLQDLGVVKVSVSDLFGDHGVISHHLIKIAHVDSVEDTAGQPEGKYIKIPRLIRPGDKVSVRRKRCQRFWLTVSIGKNVISGDYKGNITITAQNGEPSIIPLKVEVLPITLEDVPGKKFFMLMTYEFTELTMPWSEKEKRKIFESGVNVFKDYKAHGMTTVCIHSPFVFLRKVDGTPNLDDIFAALRAARDVGFTQPVIWYMGHLIQTAKARHPGNILQFDKSVHIKRLVDLIRKVTMYAKANGCPDVVFLPIDEADDAYQDPDGKRRAITDLLLQTIKETGNRSMLTASDYNMFRPVDYFCSNKVDAAGISAIKSNGGSFMVYDNMVTTKCRNPAYARYVYGLFPWLNNLDGVTSWTFQNTMNASGWPSRADGQDNDIYLAYPDPQGPLATPEWEAVSEGIEDYKLIYQLEKRINTLSQNGLAEKEYKDFLSIVGERVKKPEWRLVQAGKDVSVSSFEWMREGLLSMILDAQKRINANEGSFSQDLNSQSPSEDSPLQN